MKQFPVYIALLPALLVTTGCAYSPFQQKPKEVVIIDSVPEPVVQLESTFLVGDTLWGFAERTTGSGFNWERIKELNKIEDEKNIDAGVVLLVPPELALEAVKATQ